MQVLYLILYLIAAVLFALAAFENRVDGPRRVPINFLALGLLAWVLVPLIETAQSL